MSTFEISYKDFKVLHPVGDLPQLKLSFNLDATFENHLAIYIPHLKWDVYLNSADSPQDSGMSLVGEWGIFESVGAEKLLRKKTRAELSCTIPMNSEKIQQLIDIRSQNKMPRLGITVDGHYITYERKDGLYLLQSISPLRIDVKMYFKESKITHITFSSEELIRLLQKLKQYEFFRIEIPVRKEGKSTNKLLAEVVKILDTAKKDLLEGNYDGVLKGVRDSLADRILEKDPETKKWTLNSDIKNNFLKNAPEKAEEEYAEMLKRIGNEFHSQLRIINDVFIHKDKTRVYPRPEDAEQILFVTAYLVRYLSQSCIGN